MSNTEADIEFIRKNQYLTSFAYQIPASELLDHYWHAGMISFRIGIKARTIYTVTQLRRSYWGYRSRNLSSLRTLVEGV